MNIIQTNLKFKNSPQKRAGTKKIIIHHADATVCNMQMIHSWHIARGWSGAGYHFLVRKDGTVEAGRPIDTIGAHCTGQNSDSIGICFEGNFEQEKMSDLQLQTGRELIAYIKGIYGDIQVTEHKDFMATSCPGKNFPFEELIKVETTKKKAKKEKYKGKFPTLPTKGYLELYDRGVNVKYLQQFLNWYDNYKLVVDGVFGQKTLSAVKNFQSANKLTVDGVFGAKSLKKAKSVKK